MFKDASDLEKIKDVLKVENHLSEDGCLISKDSFVERTIFDYCKAKSLFVEPKINREIFAKLVTIEFNKKISGRSLENVPKNIDKENDLKKAFELALRAK